VTEDTLTSYRMIVEQPVHRNVSEVVIPGVLRRYDTGDLMEAVSPRPVVMVTPRDAMGVPVSEDNFRSALAHVFRSDQNMGSPNAFASTRALRALHCRWTKLLLNSEHGGQA
jgi:hypothetical protein